MAKPLAARIAAIDWKAIGARLGEDGFATTGPLLGSGECASLAGLYDDNLRFRSRVVMAQHNFGVGEYRYFSYPLPKIVETLRQRFYPGLATIANGWARAPGKKESSFPPSLAEYLARCHAAGQMRPTPLLLKYAAGGYNCLHQDLYGDHVFPFQLTVLLSPERDFQGGEFLLTEQRPRMQSRATVVPLRQGEAVIFPVRYRPVQGKRGSYRVAMRHGVSTIRSGNRFTLGVIFHDAK